MVTTVTDSNPQSINTSLFSLEKEIQEMLKRVERIKGDLDGLDVGVVSVNDKTGKVELTAEDVGALPSDTHIPADQVQSNWTETDTTKPDYIKNKPTVPTKTSQLTNDSGFITAIPMPEAVAIYSTTDPDNLPSDGARFYKVSSYNIGWHNNDGLLLHLPWSSSYIFQIAMDDESNFMAVRHKSNNTWSEWQRVQLVEPVENSSS